MGRVFVHEETPLAVSFAAAQDGLSGLARGSMLMTASQAAYGAGITGLTRVGPMGSVRGLSRLVKVRIGDPVVYRDSARLALRWEATGAGSSLFPALDADIVLTRDGEQATVLSLSGVYRPPLGSFGASLDQVLLSRVASATMRDFLGRVAQAISAPADVSPSVSPRGPRPAPR